MSRKQIILITGANGEMGKNLITYLSKAGSETIVTLDLQPLEETATIYRHITGSVLDQQIIDDINADYEIKAIYHLAAMLSTKSEYDPFNANQVNVNGTLKLIDLAIKQGITTNKAIQFFFPSSIAVYGLNSNQADPIKESECLFPKTIYGMNKLYCEQLGVYFSNNYHRLTKDYSPGLLDFRSIRFPGLISVTTQPTGGTSDYLPEMLHCAADNHANYNCFVNKDTRLPFMIMPDAIDAIYKLMSVQKSYLKNQIYNISAFSPSVEEFHNKILNYYPNFNITYDVEAERQKMVDGWPSEVCCEQALYDWDWKPNYNLDNAFSEYFIPYLKSKTIHT